jgi:predicted 3-demethylubiquinone-9 3-methyltransferase (glyoxalase superfamily)
MQKITPFLWFDGKAEEAMNFYISIFKNSKIGYYSLWRRRPWTEGNDNVRDIPTR